MMDHLPTTDEAKAQARRLRSDLAGKGTEIGHAKSLELVARQYGFRDWNTMSAVIAGAAPRKWLPGDRVNGTYLSQGFSGVLVSVNEQQAGWFRLTIELDAAIDVVAFDSFSNYRKRIKGVIGPKGFSQERTSDGTPHLQIETQSRRAKTGHET